MTDYNDGNWHVWQGKKGDVCPVHELSIGDVTYADGEVLRRKQLGVYVFDEPLMFRVTKPYREPETYTGECFAYHYTYLAPSLAETPVNTSIPGKYTATHINGKLTKIVWEASE